MELPSGVFYSWARSMVIPTLFWIGVSILVLAEAALLYITLRRRKGGGPSAQESSDAIKVEVLWMMVPLALLVALAIVTVKAIR